MGGDRVSANEGAATRWPGERKYEKKKNKKTEKPCDADRQAGGDPGLRNVFIADANFLRLSGAR